MTVFDEAIKSRIHLGMKFDDLNQKARLQVWKTFIERANKTVSKQELLSAVTEKELVELSQRPSNGRQVRISLSSL